MQEIALAKQATLHCGDDCVEWSEFAAAVALFQRRSAQIAKQFKGSQVYEHNPDFFGDINAMGASRLVLTTSNLYRKSDDGRIIDRLLSLEALVSILSDFKARERHDTFYAVLALGRDTWERSSLGPKTATTPAPSPTATHHPAAEHHGGGTSGGSSDIHEDGQLSTGAELENGNVREPSSKGQSARRSSAAKKKRSKKHNPHVSEDDRTTENAQKAEYPVHLPNGSAHAPAGSPLPLTEEKKTLLKKVGGKFKSSIDPENKRRLRVDYNLPFLDVCKQFMIFSIAKSKSLDSLCRPWAPDDEKDPLPSWVPTLVGAPFGMELDDTAAGGRRMIRQNADPLVGVYSLGRKVYAACKALTATFGQE